MTAPNLLEERVLDVKQVVRHLESICGRRLHVSAIYRWMQKGVQGVHLEHVRLGGKILTSREALGRFAQQLAKAKRTPSPGQPPRSRGRTEQQRLRDIQRAEDELGRDGI